MTRSTAPRSKKNTKSTQVEGVVLNHAETLVVESDDYLNDLMNSLMATPDSGEVIDPVTDEIVDDDTLDAAVAGAEATEAMVASATPTGVDDGAAPTGDVSDVKPTKAAKTPKEPKEKKAAIPRKHYTDKTERLKDKLGTSLSEYSVLTLADAGVADAELSAVMEATLVIIRSMSGKAQNWAVKLVESLAGKKAAMSEVTARIFKLLEKDGFIATGATGNLYLDLIAKPYSPGAARAMGGNNLAMMVALKIITPDGKGRFIPNEDSLLLLKARSVLFGTTPEEAAELTRPTDDEGELEFEAAAS